MCLLRELLLQFEIIQTRNCKTKISTENLTDKMHTNLKSKFLLLLGQASTWPGVLNFSRFGRLASPQFNGKQRLLQEYKGCIPKEFSAH